MGDHYDEGCSYNWYYLGWAILILVLLFLLIWSGAIYSSQHTKHGMHGGAYLAYQ
jgi:hypothetical protein